MAEEQPLQVARCTKIIQDEKDSDKSKYVINVKQIAKFVVNLGERVSPTDIEEGMRVGYVRNGSMTELPPANAFTVSTGISTRSCCPFLRRSTPV
jgi:26S proteasome regulatory subunit T1